MIDRSNALPDDAAALKAIIARQEAELRAQALQIEKLMAQLATEARHRYGPRSEGLDQLSLPIGGAAAAPAVAPETPTEETPTGAEKSAPVKRKPKRKPLPDHLPRETTVHRPPVADCASCGKKMRKMGEDMREILDFVPGRFVVRRHICEKFSCRDCGTIVEAELPALPIDKGAPGPALLAHVLVSKFADHIPLYRQSDIYAREGLELARSTMAGWLGKCAALLAPLAERIAAYVLAGESLHTDDTPIAVLDPGRGRTKTGRYWAHVRDERPRASKAPPAAFYRYSPNRKAEHPRAHLKNYVGFLHADGYKGYEKLFKTNRIDEVACMAHVRRKFFDIYKSTKAPLAAEALTRIAALYEIEKGLRGKPPEERSAVREKRARPLFEDLEAFLERNLPTLPAGGSLAKAMRYAIVRMRRLKVYLSDGRLEIDNNIAERSVRGVCIGKKNYLFAGSDGGGESAAVFYTLIETAKLAGVDPQAWLSHVIEKIADHPMKRIDELLPWNFRAPISGPCAS